MEELAACLVRAYGILLPPVGRFFGYIITRALAGDRLGERLGKAALTAVLRVLKLRKEELRNALLAAPPLAVSLLASCVCASLGVTREGEWYMEARNQRGAMAVVGELLKLGLPGGAWTAAVGEAVGRFGAGVVEWVEEATGRGCVSSKTWFVIGKVCRGEEGLESGRSRAGM